METRRRFLTQAAALTLPAGVVSLHADDKPAKSEEPWITPATQAEIDKGLGFIAKGQRPDGSFGTQAYMGSAAVTGLCGSALLAGGHLPGRGVHGEVLNKCVKYLLGLQDDKGLIRDARTYQKMYGHGYALQFLVSLHGQLDDAKDQETLTKVLERGLGLILKTQSPRGGWRYEPQARDEDITHTALMLMVLRGYRDAGFAVPKDTVEKAIGYVKRCQDVRSNGFGYMERGSNVKASSTAIALVGLQRAGVEWGPELEKGSAYLLKMPPRRGDNFYVYGLMYAAQALWRAGGNWRKQGYAMVHKELMVTSPARTEGYWPDRYCPHLNTAFACIALQVPKGYASAD